MKNNQNKIRKNKNTRGMALLFTLGVLMMVLVVVMMYASRVKTEAKLSSTQLDTQSAKLLAQSLLPRVMITLNESTSAQDLHLYSSGSPNQLDFDWIWKLESAGHFEFQVKPTDFTTLANKTVPFPKYVENGSSGPEYDEESMPTWQYIHSPRDDKFGRKVLARFAFVTIPQTLRLNPNAVASHVYCRGLSDSEQARKDVSSNCNLCKWRLGSSPSELFYREDMLSSATRDLIRHRHNAPNILFGKFKNSQNYSYWVDTKGFTDTFLSSDSSTSDEERTNFITDAEKYLTVNSIYSMETFWSDENGDGKKDVNEYYHRFNLRRTDWDKVGVAKGEGGSADPNGGEHNYILSEPRKYLQEHLDEIKNVNGADNNFPTGGIAWLNNWQDKGDWNDVEKTKKQIAANLINFCSPASRPVVSDVHPKDWAKSLSTKPTYTGLKRTLYLNEVYFELAIDSDVEVSHLGTNSDGTRNYKVTVEYSLDSRFFAELIDMYYNTLGMKVSSASDTPDFSAYNVYFNGSCKIPYNKPSANGNELQYTSATYNIPLDNMNFVRVEDAGSEASEYLPENNSTRRGYYLYCNNSGFNQKLFSESFTLNNCSNEITASDVQQHIKLTDKPEVTINHVVVRRKRVSSGLMKDTDTSFPSSADRDGEYENVDISLLEFNSEDIAGSSSLNLYSTSGVKQNIVLRGNFQIDDPRQNLLKSDWENAHSSKDKCYAASMETIDYENGAFDYTKIRHSLPFTYTTKAASSGGGGSDRPGRPGRPGSSGGGSSSSGGETREPNGVNFDYNGEGDDAPGVRYAKNTSSLKNPEQDYEVVAEPSWRLSKGKGSGSKASKLSNYEYSHHVSTAFIRHGDPSAKVGNLTREFGMMSPWELGAVHRGSKWKTLNIARSRTYSQSEQNFVNPSTKTNHGGNEYKYGDGPILDQIKTVNDIRTLGKIDLCQYSYDDVKNFTLGSLFLDMPLTDGNYLLHVIASDGSASSSFPISEDSLTRITPAESEKIVQEMYDAIYIGADEEMRDPGAAPEDPKVKALYDQVEASNRFFRRSDILAFNAASLSTLTWEYFNHLKIGIGKSNATDAMDEQIIGRSINQMSVEHTKVKSIKALLVVQTLRDRGKSTIRKDWNLDGKTGDTLNLRASNYLLAQLQAGYRRFSDADKNSKIFATYDGLKENINAEDWKFDPGADSITGEAKILATLVYDSTTQKWKITRYEFVE